MRCLTDGDVQAVIDGEARDEHCAHAAVCDRCRARVEERRASLATLSSVINHDEVPAAPLEARLRHAMSNVRGSTELRERPPSRWRSLGLTSALATAAVIALLVYGVLPHLGAPTTLSASEVLSRSLQTMSSAQGVERLEYEVAMDGMTRPQP